MQFDGTPLPVYEAYPLLRAEMALFGTKEDRRFPPAPGSHVIGANKSATAYRPIEGAPDPDRGEAYGVWCYIAISIAQDRTRDASLFIEDAELWTVNDQEEDLVKLLNDHRRDVIASVVECGANQGVVYERTYIGYAYEIMQPGQVGTALTVAAYVVLARNAIPEEDGSALESMTLDEWEEAFVR